MRGGKSGAALAAVLLLYAVAIVWRYAAGYPEIFSAPGYLVYLWDVAGSRLLFVTVLWLSAFGMGGALLGRRLPEFGSLLEEGLLKSFLGLVFISYSVFLLGTVGLLYPAFGYAVLLAGLGLGARGIIDYASRVYRLRKDIKPTPAGVLLVSLSAYFLLRGFYNALMPPTGFDVLMYHFGAPKLYIDAHAIYPTPDINGSYFPLGTEMLYLLAMLVEGPISANLVNYSFAIAGGLAAALFARRFLTGASPMLAFALYVSMPAVFWLMPQAYVELAMAAYTALALYALLAFFKEDNRRWLIIAALLAGFTMAIKYTGAVVFGIMLAGAAVFRLFSGKAGAKGAASTALTFLGLGVLSSAPWYIKNVVYYGNPVYPYLANYFGGGVSSVAEATAPFLSGGPGAVAWKFISSLWLTTFKAGSFSMGWSNGFGPYFLMLMPGIALFRDTPRELKYSLIFCLLTYLAIIPTGNIRYISPIFPTLAALAAYPAGMMLKDGSRALRAFGLALVLVVALSAIVANTGKQQASAFASASPGAADRYYSESATGYLASYDTWKWINANLPRDAVIYQLWDDASVLFRERKTLGSPLPFGPGSRCMIHVIQGYNRFGGFLPGPEIIDNLRKMGAGYLLVNANREGCSLPDDPYFQQNVTLLLQDKNVFLFRLNQ